MTRSHPGEIRLSVLNSAAMPSGLFQKSESEYPSAVVGTMNGMSAKVSSALRILDFPLTIYHANGSPVTMSMIETRNAIPKDA